AQRGFVETRAPEHLVELAHVIVEPQRGLEFHARPGATAQGVRHRAATFLQLLERRVHPFPTALNAWDDDERRSVSCIKHPGVLSVPQRSPGLQRVRDALLRLPLT